MSKKPKRTEFSLICRTCMSTKCLIPIFDDKASAIYYSSVIFMILGVKVKKHDGLPQKMCTKCIKFIKNSIEFRKQSQSVERILLKAENTKILKEDKSDTNIIENGSAEDLSDDETLIKYVNKDKQSKAQGKSNKFEEITKLNNINDNCFIKTETGIKNKDINNIITEKTGIKVELPYDFGHSGHNDVEFKAICIKSGGQNSIFKIKEETEHETEDRRSYNNNDTRTKHNHTGYTHNDIETEHINCNNDTGTEFHDNDIGYNHNGTENNTNSIFDHTESETHNEAINNHNNTEICHNDAGYNKNDTGPNYNDKTHNRNATKTPDNTITHNNNANSSITITEMPKNVKNNRVSCRICYKDLSYRSLDVHMSKCHPDLDERKAKCELCACYITKNRMKTHLGLHGDGFVCVYCMKEQINVESLKIHAESCLQRIKKRSDNNSAKELKECDICKKIMQKGSIRLHKQLKHAGLGPVCEHCGKRLSNKFRLSEHLRAKHGYEKHKCGLCDFQTAFRVHLKSHERRHRGEKPFVCETCGSKFHSQNQLIQHRYTHNKNKDFKCDQCPSSFKTGVHLSVHKKTTHSTSPMSCSVCTRYFRCKYYLFKHMRNVHRIIGPVAHLEQSDELALQ